MRIFLKQSGISLSHVLVGLHICPGSRETQCWPIVYNAWLTLHEHWASVVVGGIGELWRLPTDLIKGFVFSYRESLTVFYARVYLIGFSLVDIYFHRHYKSHWLESATDLIKGFAFLIYGTWLFYHTWVHLIRFSVVDIYFHCHHKSQSNRF